MLTSSGSGKVLSAQYAREREEAARDRSRFTDDELADLGISFDMGYGDRIKETFTIDSSPIDPRTTTKKKIDLRDLPERRG